MDYLAFGRSYYSSAFFRMKVDVPVSLEVLNDIPDGTMSLYLHEYVHFLQDISTIYGLMNIANILYYIHDTASRIPKSDKGTFLVPANLPDDKDDFGYNNHQLMYLYKGASIKPARKSIIVTHFREVTSSYGNKPGLTVPLIFLTANDLETGEQFEFQLGGNHVCESMAYLAEKLVYGQLLANQGFVTPVDDYPYLVVQRLAELIYPSIAGQEQLLIAVCDVSLMNYNPGLSVVRILSHLKSLGFAEGEFDIRTLYEISYSLLGLTPQLIFTVADEAYKLLQANFKSEHFEGNNRWVDIILERAVSLRMDQPDYLFSFLRPGDLKTNNEFRKVLGWLGSPMVVNADYNGTFSLPVGFDTSNFHMGFFWAINQILRVFTNNEPVPCELKNHCRASKSSDPTIVVDERCDINPWSRCHDEFLCPFAAMWKHWKLTYYEPQIKNLNI